MVILKVDNRIYIKDDAHLKLNSHSRINHFDYKNTLMDLSNLIIEAMLTPQEKEKIDNLRRIDKPIYELGLMDLVIINEGKKRRLKDAGYLDSFPEILHLAKPIAHPNKTPSIQTIKNKMVSLSKLIIKHPLWSAIIAGIAVVLFSHFVFHVP